jgi:hypothetical protein
MSGVFRKIQLCGFVSALSVVVASACSGDHSSFAKKGEGAGGSGNTELTMSSASATLTGSVNSQAPAAGGAPGTTSESTGAAPTHADPTPEPSETAQPEGSSVPAGSETTDPDNDDPASSDDDSEVDSDELTIDPDELTETASEIGDECADDSDCATDFCVDGYCCEGVCDGQCESCSERGTEGVCVPVDGAPRGERAACAGEAPCAGVCDGVDTMACAFPESTTVCDPAVCASGMATSASVCNGAGACTEAETSPCESGACATGGTTCNGSCSSDSCGEGRFCDTSGACFDKRANGQACTIAGQCLTANCVDGVCCDGACTGQCQACNAAGTCARKSSGAPSGGRAACDGAGTECGGTCDGSSDSCSYPDTSIVCGESSCSADLARVDYTTCNGAGACSTDQVNQCSGATYCSGESCVGKKSTGACEVPLECTSGNCATNPATSAGLCCASGQANCGSCVTTATDNANCGACGTACTTGKTCQSGGCVCTAGASLSCGSCGSWTFESSTFEGWLNVRNSSYGGGNSPGTTSIRNAQHPSGAASGRVLVVEFSGEIGVAGASVGLCSSGDANVDDMTFSADIYLEIDSGDLDFEDRFIFLEVWDSVTGTTERPLLRGLAVSDAFKWLHVEGTFTLTSATHIGFSLYGLGDAVGRAYVDNITLE